MFVTSSFRRRRDDRGFTLIELLVTLAIVAIGLLGVAKLQAAAVAETAVARTRALMTFQAESLAGAMRANEGFWQSSAVYNQTVAIAAGGTFTQSPASMVLPPTADSTCISVATCAVANLAYDDVATWAKSFAKRFPTATGAIVCNGSVTVPVTCDITLSWTERTVAINRTTAAAGTAAVAAPQASSMVLHVQP